MHPIWSFRLGVFCAWFLAGNGLFADDWPQWLGPRRDSVWRESGIVEKFPTNGPPIRWRASIGGGYAGPVVAKGRVYVADRQLAQGASNPADPFDRREVRGFERVLCLSEADGQVLWKYEYECPYTISYPAGPRVAPLVSERQGLYARRRGESALPRREQRQGPLVAGLQEGLRHQGADVGLRRASRCSTATV